jgi:hypothetical protein
MTESKRQDAGDAKGFFWIRNVRNPGVHGVLALLLFASFVAARAGRRAVIA